jgi:DNA-binding IclR family transcriptional regulator
MISLIRLQGVEMARYTHAHTSGPTASLAEPMLLSRAATILNAFAGPQPTLSLTEVVRICGLPQSTVHRLMDQLVQIGWLEREQRRYRLGLPLLELGAFAAHHNRLRQAALPHLMALHQSTGAWAHLAVLDGPEIVYLEQVGDPRQRAMPFPAGARLPAHCTAAGKALLAFSRDRMAAAAAPWPPLTPRTRRTITRPDLLELELADVRSDRVAFDRQECFDDVNCIAVPLRGAGWALAAISVSRNTGSTDLSGLAPKVSACARTIWSSLFATVRRAEEKKPTLTAPDPETLESTADSTHYWLRFREWS